MSTPPVNSCNSSAGLIEKYINSAYDNVKAVADNLDYLDQIYQFLLQYGLITNIAVKAPVQAVATSPITLSGNQVLTWSAHSGDHSVLATTGMRVLVLGQTNPVENGIYDVQNNAWARSVDFDGPKDVVDGTLVFSSQGDVWQVDGPQYSLVPGTDPIVFRDIDLFAYEALREATEKAQEAAASAAAALASEQAAKVSEDNAASFEVNAGNSAAAAAISETNAKVSENNAKSSELSAQNLASLAESVTNNTLTFATTVAGIAGTTNGQYFRVPQGSGATLSFIYYLNNSGTAQVVAEMPGKVVITNNIRSYSSLAVAQADVTAGNILNGTYCYVRNSADKVLADEYINNGGTLVATGRKMPSQKYIDELTQQSGLLVDAVSANMTLSESIQTAGSTVVDKLTIAKIVSASNHTQTLQSVEAVVGAESIKVSLLPGDTFADGELTTEFLETDIGGTTNLGVNISSTVSKIYTQPSLAPNSVFNSTYGVNVFDLAGVYPAVSQVNAETVSVPSVYGHASGFIAMAVPNSVITGAGHELTSDGVKAWFADNVQSLHLKYRSSVTSKSYQRDFIGISSGNLVVTAGANIAFRINLYTVAEDASTTVVESDQLTTYTADVVNNTPVSYTNDLVELKVEFGPSEVSSHDAISVRDADGNVFTAQFASFFAPNFRKLRDDSKYSDGSFKEGSILFKDSFPSGAKKEYVVMTKGNYSAGSAYPKLTDSGVDKVITVGAYTYKFNGASYYEMKSIKGGLAEVAPLDISRCQVYINAATTDVFFTHNPSIKLVNSGPLFSEVERTSYNAATSVLPAGSIRVITRYRIFADGRIHMRTIFRVETSIAAGILLGVRQDFRIPFTGTAVSQSTGAPAVYLPSSNADGLPYHQVITIANGDISREGETDGPTRPPIADAGAFAGYRTQAGFLITNTAGLSFNNFGYAKGWSWSYEVKIRQNTPFANVADAIKAELNAPIGFLTVGSNLFVEKRRALERFKKYIDAFQDFYTDAEYGLLAKSDVTKWFYPQLFGLLKCLRTGGNFENQYAVFKSFMTANIASDLSTAGSVYLAGTMLLQFHGRMVMAAAEMYYRYAKLKGVTSVKTDLEIYIKSMCDAFVTKVNANGFIPLQGNWTFTPANNANAEGLRMLGLGIFAGLDTGGSYSAAFDTVVNNMLAQAPSAQGIAPCVIDAPATSLSQNHWLSYDAHVAYVINRAFKLAGKTKTIDNTNLMLRGIVGSGEMRHIDANVSESRRWGIETVGAIAIALLDARRTSTCGAANKVLDSYDDLWGPNFVANQAIGAFDIAKGFDKATFNMVFNINQLCLPVIDAMLDEL